MIHYNQKLSISSKVTLPNRVVVPPMASATSNSKGFPTQVTFDHYKRLTEAGAGMVMVEYTYVHPTGKSEDNQLGAYSDEHIEGLARIAQIINDSGAKSALQIVHGGGKSTRELTGGELLTPSDIKVPAKDRDLEEPRAATIFEVKMIIDAFIKAASRGIEAGYDIIELHCAHGYGLNQWLSPLTNQRNDNYGGSKEKRAKILFDIVGGILTIHPEAQLSMRIPGMDHMEGGLSREDSIWLTQELERRGVKIINVSSGIGGWRRPRTRKGEGYLVSDAAPIQRATALPVIGVGGIKSSDYINEQLNKHSFSLAAVGRAILEDPKGFGSSIGLIR